MKAMILEKQGALLRPAELPEPVPEAGQVLLRVLACGICRTDLHVIDGDLRDPALPLVLGHEIVGEVVSAGEGVTGLEPGRRVGVPWLGWTCGDCDFCRSGQENLCDGARFTGYNINGGFAEYTVADSRFCFPLPETGEPARQAPLLCAGLIGYRALRFCGDAKILGLYGFGASAHILVQVAVKQGRRVFAFTRPGDRVKQDFARALGAEWAGGSDQAPPEAMDAAILLAPAGETVPESLAHVRKGGRVVCGGIHMSPIPSFLYDLLWGERSVVSVANLTRQDALEFLPLSEALDIRTSVETFPLAEANVAIDKLRRGRVRGAAVLTP